MAQLALVLGAAAGGGLSGVSSEQALRVVEAVETVKAWADSVSLDATAAMVTEFETERVHLAPQTPTTRGWQLFFRHCRSAAAREIQVATGPPISQCQRRVWLTACEPERVGPVREAMRVGQVTLARAMALTEGNAHLDAFIAAAIATRVLRPLNGPDGLPLPGLAPLSEPGVALIPGWGCMSAQQARGLALATGSIWRRVVTDPLTGRAIETTSDSYTVPAGMAGQVKTRDGVCRAPGCEIPAERCDLDHSVEWEPHDAGGPTAETNLAAVHRGHHNLKTGGFWDSEQLPDGTLTWTTATGRTVTTYPYVYDHADNIPVRASLLEAHHGRLLAPVLNPDIPLPGHLSIFEQIDWARALAPTTPTPRQHTWARVGKDQTPVASGHSQGMTAAPDVLNEDVPPPF